MTIRELLVLSGPTDRKKRFYAYVVGMGLTFLDGLSLGILVPLLPLLVLEFNGSPATATAIIAAFTAASLVGSLAVGRLSDRFGRQAVLLISLAGSILSLLALAFASSLVVIFAARIASGLLGARVPVVSALVTDGAPKGGQASRLSWTMTLSAVGTLGGPLLGSIIAKASPLSSQHHNILVCSVALAVLGFLLVCGYMLVLPEQNAGSVEKPVTRASSGIPRPMWGPLLAAATVQFGWVIFTITSLTVRGRFGWGVIEVGYLLAFLAGLVAIGRPFALPVLTRRVGVAKAYVALCVCAALALCIMGVARDPTLFIIGVGLFATCGLANVIPSVATAQVVDSSERGYAFGLLSVFSGVGSIASTLIAGRAMQVLGDGAPYYFGALVVAAGAAIMSRIATTTHAPAVTPGPIASKATAP